jgi:hypothetical protein
MDDKVICKQLLNYPPFRGEGGQDKQEWFWGRGPIMQGKAFCWSKHKECIRGSNGEKKGVG